MAIASRVTCDSKVKGLAIASRVTCDSKVKGLAIALEECHHDLEAFHIH